MAQRQEVSVILEDVTYQVKNRSNRKQMVNLLDSLSVCAAPGNLVGLMGTSGAGKTTLLNVVASHARSGKRSQGNVLFNNAEHAAQVVKGFTNMVMAQDKLIAHLTVEETFRTAAKLKMPFASKEEIEKRVDGVIDELRLHHARHVMVGGEWKKGCSSGEMRRVSIGIELIDDPSVLLLDEPTTGLDSALAYDLINLLWDISRLGRTVIVSIHQPRSQVFKLFDQLILINLGRLVFQGPPNDVKPHFETLGFSCPASYNPADFVMELLTPSEKNRGVVSGDKTVIDREESFDTEVDILAKDSMKSTKDIEELKAGYFLTTSEIEALVDSWKGSEAEMKHRAFMQQTKENSTPLDSSIKSRFLTQTSGKAFKQWFLNFGTLFVRSTRIAFRNPLLWFGIIFIHLVDALILGGVFWKLRSPVEGIVLREPTITPETLETPWMKYFFEGPFNDGTRPLVDVVLDGIDGNGSRLIFEGPTKGPEATDRSETPPLPSLRNLEDYMQQMQQWTDTVSGLADSATTNPTSPIPGFCKMKKQRESPLLENGFLNTITVTETATEAPPDMLNFVEDIANCTYCKYEIWGKGWPLASYTSLSGNHKDFPDAIDLDPNRITSIAIKVLQVLGQLWDYTDYQYANELLNHFWNGPPLNDNLLTGCQACWWLRLISDIKDKFDPIVECIGWPPLPSLREDAWIDPLVCGLFFRCSRIPSLPASVRQLEPQQVSIHHGRTDPLLTHSKEVALSFLPSNEKFSSEFVYQTIRKTMELEDDIDEVTGGVAESLIATFNTAGALFFVVGTLKFASYNVLMSFAQERALLNRETANGMYKISCYYAARTIADLPFQVIPTILFAVVFYFMAGLSLTAYSIGYFFLGCFVMSFSFYGLAYLIAAASPAMEVAVLVAPVVLTILAVLAGFFIRDADMPKWIGWFRHINMYRWGYQSVILTQFPPGGTFGALPNELCLEITGVNSRGQLLPIGACFGLGVACRIFGFIALKFLWRSVGLE